MRRFGFGVGRVEKSGKRTQWGGERACRAAHAGWGGRAAGSCRNRPFLQLLQPVAGETGPFRQLNHAREPRLARYGETERRGGQLENKDPDRQPFFENVDLAYTIIFAIGAKRAPSRLD
jgi:hypothetical protein